MKDNLKLYYDATLHAFSTSQSNTNHVVFEANQKEDPANVKGNIECDYFRIRMHTTCTIAPQKEYLYVDIYINDILLIPLSLSCRKADINYHFKEHEITFQQWGAGNNANQQAHTIMLRDKELDWSILLSKICQICNNYESWITQEIKQLIVSLETHSRTKFWDIATFIELARRYDVIVPEIIPVYRDFVDKYCYQAINELASYIERQHLENKHWESIDRNNKAIYGDILWKYIKDYILLS